MSEEWKPVEGYEGLYEVSNTGLVKSLKRGRILKPTTTKVGKGGGGYLFVGLYKNRKQKFFKVHRLVATAFIPNPENKYSVEHWDANKTNNHVDNLCWATHSEQEQTKPCKGYCWDKAAGKWHVRITIPGQKKHKFLGRFEREEDAAAKYIAAKYIYHPFWVKQQEHLKKEKIPIRIRIVKEF